MPDDRIEFYQEVEVCADGQYQGLKGAVLGIGEEDGVIYSYAVSIHGKSHLVSFNKDDLTPTGVYFTRDDFY